MPIRIFVDGERPSASDFNRYFMQQQYVMKLSNLARASTTTLTADPNLSMAVVAGTDYWVTAYLFYNGPTQATATGNIKLNFDAPAGSTFDWVSDGLGGATVDANAGIDIVSRTLQSLGSTPAPGTIGTSTPLTVLVKGLLRVGPTSGNFFLQWAQEISSATAVTLFHSSMVVARRLTA